MHRDVHREHAKEKACADRAKKFELFRSADEPGGSEDDCPDYDNSDQVCVEWFHGCMITQMNEG